MTNNNRPPPGPENVTVNVAVASLVPEGDDWAIEIVNRVQDLSRRCGFPARILEHLADEFMCNHSDVRFEEEGRFLEARRVYKELTTNVGDEGLVDEVVLDASRRVFFGDDQRRVSEIQGLSSHSRSRVKTRR